MEIIAIVLAVLLVCLWIVLSRRIAQTQAGWIQADRELQQARTEASALREHTQRQEQRLGDAEARTETLRQKLSEAERANAGLEARLEALGREYDELKQGRGELVQELEAKFRVLSEEVLRERTASLEERSKELLKPLSDDLKRFGERVEATYSQEARERQSLQGQIKELVERSMQLGQEADQLSRALRGDAKVQGNWGEMVLEKILEGSGLQRGKEYFVQEQVQTSEGRFVPDVIIQYPNGGRIVIDSKVSLTAYTDYVNAADDADRRACAIRHLRSVRAHIDELSGKRYDEVVEQSAGFVMMFVPNEPAYALAIQECPTLWEDAYRKQVVLMNGTNLIAALRMALDLWQRDRQIRSVEKIVDEAGKMYDKFVLFSKRLLEAEKRLEQAGASLSEARKSLSEGRGNIVGRLEKLGRMGLKIKERIPDPIAQASDEEYDRDDAEDGDLDE